MGVGHVIFLGRSSSGVILREVPELDFDSSEPALPHFFLYIRIYLGRGSPHILLMVENAEMLTPQARYIVLFSLDFIDSKPFIAS